MAPRESVTVEFRTDSVMGQSEGTKLIINGMDVAPWSRRLAITCEVGQPTKAEIELHAMDGLVWRGPATIQPAFILHEGYRLVESTAPDGSKVWQAVPVEKLPFEKAVTDGEDF